MVANEKRSLTMKIQFEPNAICHLDSQEQEALSFLPQDQWLDFILYD